MSKIIGPNLVTSGLVLHLDAANPKSYQSGSTSWFDISGNNNNGTLVSGSGYSSANFGSITFDGVNDYVATNVTKNQIPVISDITLAGWIYSTNTGLDDEWIILSNLRIYAPIFHNVALAKNPSNLFYFNNYDGTEHRSLSNNVLLNTWVYVVGVRSTDVNYLYINGILQSSPVASGTPNINNSATLKIGGAAFYSKGNLANVQIYNRALSPSEVLQNFNATRGRFGI